MEGRERDREKDRETKRKGERQREGETKREGEREREICPELLSLFLKGMMGALAPFSYLIINVGGNFYLVK